MPDGENIKFCSTHGEILDNMVCSKCAAYWDGHPNPPEHPGRKNNYLQDKLDANGMILQLTAGLSPKRLRYVSSYCLCHNCRYVNWHPIWYCPKCGSTMDSEKLTRQELADKYPDYQTGY